jgi:hypothetical protein
MRAREGFNQPDSEITISRARKLQSAGDSPALSACASGADRARIRIPAGAVQRGLQDAAGRSTAAGAGRAHRGRGYPAALARSQPHRRAAWYRDYLDAIVQRDVRDLARISALETLPRLLSLAAAQTARLLNVSDLAAPFSVSRPTIRDYVTLLEGVFLLEELQPWHTNRLSRLVKTPKLHMGAVVLPLP